MEVIILAGGLGTRLRKLSGDLPKPMMPVCGKPFLEILLDSLSRKGITHVVLSVGYKANVIVSYFGNQYNGMRISYSLESRPIGTGGGVRLAMDKIEDDHTFIINGDTYMGFDFAAIEDHWLKNSRPIIVALSVADRTRYGSLVCEKGIAISLSEKGNKGPGLINAGCYILKRDQLNSFNSGESFSLEKDYLVNAIAQRKFDVIESFGTFIDIGVPNDYYQAQKMFNQKDTLS